MKLLWIAISFITLFALVSPSAAAPILTTNAVSGISAGAVTLNGNAAGIGASMVVWFEYGSLSGVYPYKTSNQTITVAGAFTKVVSGMPLISGKTYYYKAVGMDGTGIYKGAEVSFTTSTISAIPDYNFDANFDNLTNSELEPQNLSKVSSSAYTDVLGSVFWGIIYSLIFIVIWIRQKDVTIPSILGFIIGATLWSSMPADWTSMAMALTVVSLAGLMYTILRGRK